MAIVRQHDKRSGITYVYESTSYWDKEKQQSRSHRKLIGRLDPETGKVVPTKGWGKRRGQSKDKASAPLRPEKEAPCRQFIPSGFSMALPISLTRLERLQVLLLI